MSENSSLIIPHQHRVSTEMRNTMKGHKSCFVLLTGLSGAGKSTIASALEMALFERGIHTFLLDGDNLRKGLNCDLTFTQSDRAENLRRMSEVSALLLEAGIVTIAAFIAPFEAERLKLKERLSDYVFVEVYVSCDLSICESRDTKGLYAKARQGLIKNFTGISAPYEAPSNPDVTLNTAQDSITTCVNNVLNKLLTVIYN